MQEFVDEFFTNFVHEFKYEILRICANSYEFFARKIGYVMNGLYCMVAFKSIYNSILTLVHNN